MKKDESLEDHQRYYNAYWSDHEQRLNTHEIIRLAEILSGVALVTERTNKMELKICDLGCGRGWLSNELSKFGPVTGVDLSVTGVSAAQAQWPTVEFEVADITKWRPDRKYDLVVSSEVIEHVPDQQAFSETVRQMLSPQGYLILTTPNANVKKAWDKSESGAQLIEQWLSPRKLRSLFPEFQIISHRTFIFDFTYRGISRVTSAPKILKALNALGLLPFYNATRSSLDLGLYQIIVGQFLPSRHS